MKIIIRITSFLSPGGQPLEAPAQVPDVQEWQVSYERQAEGPGRESGGADGRAGDGDGKKDKNAGAGQLKKKSRNNTPHKSCT